MNIKQDPGCAPGFERSVNAEPGPMGAGAGAAAAIDNNEPSPRGAAIEKAQAELRRDLAVREERRRELEFLEKGGEPLDFKFGEAPLANFSPLSPKEAVVDGLLPLKSEEEAVCTVDAASDGDCPNGRRGCVGAAEGLGDMSVVLVPGNEQSCSRLSSLDVGAGDPSWALNESASKTDVDSCQGGHGRPKSAGHVNRNRVRSQRLGNGHALSKEVEGVAGGERQVAERESAAAPGGVENEGMVDMSYQVLPHQSQHGLPSKWNGLTGGQEYEPVNEIMARCGPVLEQHPSEHSSRDRASLPSVKSVQAPDVRGGSRAVASGRDSSDRSSLGGECSPYQAADSQELAVGVGERRDGRGGARQAEGISHSDAVGADPSRGCGDDAGGGDGGTGRREGAGPVVGAEKRADAGAGSRDVSGSGQEGHGSEGRAAHESRGQMGGDGPAHRDPRGLKKGGGVSPGGSHARVGRPAAEERKVSLHHVRLKVEDGVAEDRAKHLATQAEAGAHEINGAHSQELRTGGQAGATVGGAARSMGRLSSNFGTPNCKYPGVVLPWEKGQDSGVQGEAERHNAEHRERQLNKAREDFVLEEAEQLKVKRKLLEERKTMKAYPEPARRKSHWDYVLEEMKWMANDFWQERMWKRYQAAHVCLEIAMKKGEEDFLAADLAREQHRVARILASAVRDFWHTAEVAVTKEKSESRSSGQAQAGRRTSESEVVPMDVDFPATREAPEKAARHEKGGKEQLIGVRKYAIQLLKESGLLRMGPAEPPPTPERQRECSSILEQVHEVPLFYEVPMGSMGAYRAAVEAEHARSEEEHERRRAAASAEAEALAADAAEDASAGGDAGYAEFSNDGGSQEDEPAIFTTEGSRISRKKRKKIFKTSSIGARGEGGALQGLPYRAPGLLSSEPGLPSPLVTGKRSLTGGSGANSLPGHGSIPVKRARSSAANLRPRGTQPGASPGGYMAQRGVGSQFQVDDGMDALDGPNQGDVSSDTPGSKGVAGDGRLKKKKKTKPYPGLSFSDGGTAADTPAKNSDGSGQDVRHEQMKRKADTHWVSIGGSDAGLDTPGTPGSQGLSGPQSSKKQKSLRQAETNSEAVQAGPQAGSALGAGKLLRQNSMRDRNRRVRPATKVPPSTPTGGVGIPWSAGEDQAILALVHDLGPNWELVSDVLSSNSQIKGICRKPVQCKERHKALTERVGSEGLENTEDPSSSQPQASKGNMRGPRGQSAAEEDTLKHFEQIIIIVQNCKQCWHSNGRLFPACPDCGVNVIQQSESEDQKVLQASHSSHGIIMSQFWTGIGGTSNPVDLADRVTGSDDPGAHPHPAQAPQGNVLGPPIVGPMAGLGMRPPAGGLPLVLPGPNGLHGLGQGSVSPVAMSAAAARDAQRLNMSSFSNEEHARLQMATKQLTDFNARRAQQQAASAASGVPVLGGLGNSNGLPMLSTSTSGGMLVGLNRGLSLPRAGLAGMGSPVVSSMGTAGLSGRLPQSGNLAATNVSRRIAGLVNMARNAGCTEEQRLQALQQLQSMAQQGDVQAGAMLASLTGGGGGDMGNPVDGLNQPFSLHHQHSPQQHQHQQQQQQQQQHHQQQQQHQLQEQHQQLHQQQLHHMNNSSSKLQAQVQQHGHQMQLAGGPQAYVAVPTRMKEQQHQQQQLQRQQQLQQLQQQQQKQKLLGSLSPNPQAQHMLVPPHQAGAAGLPGQHLKAQPHILPPQQHNSLQKQLMQQVGSPSQGAQLSVASSSLQSSPASPGKSGQQATAGQQSERAGQMAQGGLSAKPPQPNQGQKQLEQQASQMLLQQQAMRNPKGVSRGAMLMQGSAAQAAQAGGLGGGGGGNGQLQVEAGGGQMQAGQRGVSQGQAQGGKAGGGSQAGNPGGGGGGGGGGSQGGQGHGAQSQTLSSVVGGQKGGQQQGAQGGAGKQQQGATPQGPGQPGGQQAGPAPSAPSSQQPAMAASSGGPSQQAQQQAHRRQVGQAQAPRRLQTKHPSTSMGAPIAGQLAKTGAQAAGAGAPSQMGSGGQNPYQFGGAIAMGMSNPGLHGMGQSSALNSSAVEAQAAQWKAGQALPPLGGGMYNLTRTSSPGPGQGPAMASSGVHSNGNVMGAASVAGGGLQGAVGVGSAGQGVGGVQGGPGLLSQKLGAGPGMGGRGLGGAQVGGQRSQPSSSAGVPSYQARPPTASPTSSAGGAAASQGGAAAGPYPGGAGPAGGPAASSGQVRQPHGEHASSGGSAASSQRGGIAGAGGGASSDGSIAGAAADRGGTPAAESAAASSS